MKKLVTLLLCVVLSFAATAADKTFDRVVVFGDSLSDNGNLYRYMWYLLPASPPYYEGHFSNGPLWIEYLYESYFGNNHPEAFLDYAVGGAGAILSYKENLPFTITIELNDYLYWHTDNQKESTLYSIWIGANNYLNGPTNVEPLTRSVVDAIGNVIERLIGYGGNKFLIVNLPDMGRLPMAKDNNSQALLSELTLAHNKKLAEKVVELRDKYPETTFVYFDMYSFLEQAIAHASDYGITNIEDACYTGGFTGVLQTMMADDQQLYDFYEQQNPKFKRRWQMIKNNPQLKEAAQAGFIYQLLALGGSNDSLDCKGYLYWDRVHPTTVAHSFIGQQARTLLDEAGLLAFTGEKSE